MSNQPSTPKSESLILLEAMCSHLAAMREELQALYSTVSTLADSNASVVERMEKVVAALASPAAASSQPAAAAAPNGYVDFAAEKIIQIVDDKGTSYKIKGGRYTMHGVRVWPEILPELGIDEKQLKPGANPFTARVRALLGDTGQPRKVIGLADNSHLGPQAGIDGDEPPF